MSCEQELCRYWTGHGCACDVHGLEPDVVSDDDPEPVECEACLGQGTVPKGYGRSKHNETCGACFGDGVREREE